MDKATRKELKDAYIKGMKEKMAKGEWHGAKHSPQHLHEGMIGSLIGVLGMMIVNSVVVIILMFLQGFGITHLPNNVFMTYIITSALAVFGAMKALGILFFMGIKRKMMMHGGMHRGGGRNGIHGIHDRMHAMMNERFGGCCEDECCDDEDEQFRKASAKHNHDIKDLS